MNPRSRPGRHGSLLGWIGNRGFRATARSPAAEVLSRCVPLTSPATLPHSRFQVPSFVGVPDCSFPGWRRYADSGWSRRGTAARRRRAAPHAVALRGRPRAERPRQRRRRARSPARAHERAGGPLRRGPLYRRHLGRDRPGGRRPQALPARSSRAPRPPGDPSLEGTGAARPGEPLRERALCFLGSRATIRSSGPPRPPVTKRRSDGG
jgi:hypothetical protein